MSLRIEKIRKLLAVAASIAGVGAMALVADLAHAATAIGAFGSPKVTVTGAFAMPASTYYIDSSHPAASDKNAGTSPSLPWASLAPASGRRLVPGDTISLKAGTAYDGALTIQSKGTATAPITVNSFGGGTKPVIRGNPTFGSGASAITLYQAAYVIVDGLSLSRAAYAGINAITSDNVIIRNNEMFDVGMGVNLGGQNNVVTDNYFHDLKMIKNGNAGSFGAVAITVLGPNNEIAYNTCRRCIAPDAIYGYNGGMIELYGTVDNAYIHHNFAQDSDGFLEAGVGTARNVRIVYNVSYNNDGNFICIHYAGQFAYTGPTSFLVANNTVVQNQAALKPVGTLNSVDTPPASSSVLFVNNIFSIDNVPSIYANDVPRLNNIYQIKAANAHVLGNWSNALGVGEKLSDPGFVNAQLPDLRLAATSPARGKALVSSAVGVLDFARAPLPASGRDIGAYQYQ